MLDAERNTSARTGMNVSVDMAASMKILAGALTCINATGYAERGDTSTTLRGLGRACGTVDNSDGDDGDLKIEVETGVFRYGNSDAADEITIADRTQVCYIVDDETVAKTNGVRTRSRAGFVVDVDDQGVWVLLGFSLYDAPDGALAAALNLDDLGNKATAFANIKQAATTAATGVVELATSAETQTGADTVRAVTPKGAADTYCAAANNLSEIANAATARGHLGVEKLYLPLHIPDLKTVEAWGIPAPRAGTITEIRSVLGGHALATGDATLTGKIATTAITTGVVTITQAGSAIGDKDSATPSAANVVAAGDWINFTVGGTNDNTAAFADLLIEITY